MKPIDTIDIIGGPHDGAVAEWITDERPREGQQLEAPPDRNGVRSVYRFERGVWRYVKIWREP